MHNRGLQVLANFILKVYTWKVLSRENFLETLGFARSCQNNVYYEDIVNK